MALKLQLHLDDVGRTRWVCLFGFREGVGLRILRLLYGHFPQELGHPDSGISQNLGLGTPPPHTVCRLKSSWVSGEVGSAWRTELFRRERWKYSLAAGTL